MSWICTSGASSREKGLQRESLTEGSGGKLPNTDSSHPKMTVGQEYEQLRTIFQRDPRILGNIGNQSQKEQISYATFSRKIQI